MYITEERMPTQSMMVFIFTIDAKALHAMLEHVNVRLLSTLVMLCLFQKVCAILKHITYYTVRMQSCGVGAAWLT